MFDWVINLLHAISIGLSRMKRMEIDEEACSELASNEWDVRKKRKKKKVKRSNIFEERKKWNLNLNVMECNSTTHLLSIPQFFIFFVLGEGKILFFPHLLQRRSKEWRYWGQEYNKNICTRMDGRLCMQIRLDGIFKFFHFYS